MLVNLVLFKFIDIVSYNFFIEENIFKYHF